MSIEEYKKLSADNQFSKILKEGHLIDHKIKGARSRSLYAVDKFFVEVHYNISQSKILGQLPFESGNLLNKYSGFEKIDGLDFLDSETILQTDELEEYTRNYLNLVKGKPYSVDLLSNEVRLLGQNHRYKKEIEEIEETHQACKNQVSDLLDREKEYHKEKKCLWGIIIIELIFVLMML